MKRYLPSLIVGIVGNVISYFILSSPVLLVTCIITIVLVVVSVANKNVSKVFTYAYLLLVLLVLFLSIKFANNSKPQNPKFVLTEPVNYQYIPNNAPFDVRGIGADKSYTLKLMISSKMEKHSNTYCENASPHIMDNGDWYFDNCVLVLDDEFKVKVCEKASASYCTQEARIVVNKNLNWFHSLVNAMSRFFNTIRK